MSNENKMGYMPIPKLLANMALPIMASMLVQALYNVVDSMYISRMLLKEEALSAVSLAFPIQMLIISVSTGTGIGANSLIARLLGEKNHKDASSAARNSIFLSAVSGLLFFFLSLTIVRPYFNFMTENETIITMGCDYLTICFSCSIFVIYSIVGERILQSTGRTVFSMLSQMAGAVVNIILDPIMIFGYFGFPAMGIKGAAIATVAGQFVSFFTVSYLNFKKNGDLDFSFKGFKPDKKIIGQIFKVGAPSILLQSVASVLNIGLNTILAGYSMVAVSILGIYFKLQSFVFMPVFGLTNALIPIVSYNYGAQNKERIIKTLKLCSLTAFFILGTGTLLFSFMGDTFLTLMFDATPAMIEIGVIAFRVISLSFIPAAFSIVLSCSFQALGNGVYSLILSVSRQLVFVLPIAYMLGKLYGLNAVWFAFPVAEFLGTIIAVCFFSKMYREKIAPLP